MEAFLHLRSLVLTVTLLLEVKKIYIRSHHFREKVSNLYFFRVRCIEV